MSEKLFLPGFWRPDKLKTRKWQYLFGGVIHNKLAHLKCGIFLVKKNVQMFKSVQTLFLKIQTIDAIIDQRHIGSKTKVRYMYSVFPQICPAPQWSQHESFLLMVSKTNILYFKGNFEKERKTSHLEGMTVQKKKQHTPNHPGESGTEEL